ncbi:hypothetical protein MHYP_G00133170 [Metynnis hypsauchen]
MRRQILIVLTVLHSISGQNYDIHQNPLASFGYSGEYRELHCNHSVSDFYNILWYQQSIGDSSLKLIANVYYKSPNVESSFKGHFNVSGDGAKHSTLHLLKLRPAEDSAVYYCAASQAQCSKSPHSSTKTSSTTEPVLPANDTYFDRLHISSSYIKMLTFS